MSSISSPSEKFAEPLVKVVEPKNISDCNKISESTKTHNRFCDREKLGHLKPVYKVTEYHVTSQDPESDNYAVFYEEKPEEIDENNHKTVKEKFEDAKEKVTEKLSEIAHDTKENFKEYGHIVKEKTVDAVHHAKERVEDIFEEAKEKIAHTMESIKHAGHVGVEEVEHLGTRIKEKITGPTSESIEAELKEENERLRSILENIQKEEKLLNTGYKTI